MWRDTLLRPYLSQCRQGRQCQSQRKPQGGSRQKTQKQEEKSEEKSVSKSAFSHPLINSNTLCQFPDVVPNLQKSRTDFHPSLAFSIALSVVFLSEQKRLNQRLNQAVCVTRCTTLCFMLTCIVTFFWPCRCS